MYEADEWSLPWGPILVGLSLALVAVLVLSWRLRPTTQGPPTLVVGDSVTYLSAGQIQQHLGGNNLQFVAKPSYPSSLLLPLVLEAVDTSGSPAAKRNVIALLVGYNDVRLRELDTEALPALVRVSSQFRCAVWLALPARPGGADNPNQMVPSSLIDEWNDRLELAAAQYDNVHVAHDWENVVTRAPADVMLQADLLHPTDAGKRRLADAYEAAIARHCPEPEPTD